MESRRGEEKGRRHEKAFGEIIAEIVSKFDDNDQLRPPKKPNELRALEAGVKTFGEHIVIKLPGAGDKEDIAEAARGAKRGGGGGRHLRGNKTENDGRFLIRNNQSKRTVEQHP